MKDKIENKNKIFEIQKTFVKRINIIYVYTIEGVISEETKKDKYLGRYKVGMTHVDLDKDFDVIYDADYSQNETIKKAVNQRIHKQSNTIDMTDDIVIEHISIALNKDYKSFKDHDIHYVLKSAGIKKRR